LEVDWAASNGAAINTKVNAGRSTSFPPGLHISVAAIRGNSSIGLNDDAEVSCSASRSQTA
jgi:hypothetical protein